MKFYKLLFSIFLFFFFPLIALAEDFNITSKNVILYNMNDDIVLYEKASEEKTSIASLTKIMTTIISIENIDDLNEFITIKSEDLLGLDGYSKAGFKVGDRVTYLDLLYGIMLPSGADAVKAAINNTLKDQFVLKMNEKAKELNLNNTSFENGIGMDNVNNYSTAKDLATLLKYALKNEYFRKIFTTNIYKTTNGLVLKKTISVYSDILNINLIKGAKSGFTKEAGRCLASITTLNDVDYLLIVINSDTDKPYRAVEDTINIYDYYSSNYSYQNILTDDSIIKIIPIKWSKEKYYQITGSEEIKKYLKNNESNNLEYKYEGIEEIKEYTKKGTKLGNVKIYSNNTLLAESPVYLENEINYYYPINYLIIILIFITIIIIIIAILKKKGRKKRGKN